MSGTKAPFARCALRLSWDTADNFDEGVDDTEEGGCNPSKRAEAKISADDSTRRSDEVYIYYQLETANRGVKARTLTLFKTSLSDNQKSLAKSTIGITCSYS